MAPSLGAQGTTYLEAGEWLGTLSYRYLHSFRDFTGNHEIPVPAPPNLEAKTTIHSFDGCFSARFVLSSPSASISHHAWGAAVDVNADTNRFATSPSQDPRLVDVMRRWGFTWGGDWIVPDGMHFEYLTRPSAG